MGVEDLTALGSPRLAPRLQALERVDPPRHSPELRASATLRGSGGVSPFRGAPCPGTSGFGPGSLEASGGLGGSGRWGHQHCLLPPTLPLAFGPKEPKVHFRLRWSLKWVRTPVEEGGLDQVARRPPREDSPHPRT